MDSVNTDSIPAVKRVGMNNMSCCASVPALSAPNFQRPTFHTPRITPCVLESVMHSDLGFPVHRCSVHCTLYCVLCMCPTGRSSEPYQVFRRGGVHQLSSSP
eukprot:scpid109675/ scgid25265/ 